MWICDYMNLYIVFLYTHFDEYISTFLLYFLRKNNPTIYAHTIHIYPHTYPRSNTRI
jgi:hypothetical protein